MGNNTKGEIALRILKTVTGEESTEYLNNRDCKLIQTSIFEPKKSKDKSSSEEKTSDSQNTQVENQVLDEFYKKTEADFQENLKYLSSVGIKYSFPDVSRDSLWRTAIMLSVTEDAARITKSTDGNTKVVSVMNFDQRVRFYPVNARIADDELIRKYKLVLKNGYISKEYFETDGSNLRSTGKIEIEYRYDKANYLVNEISTITETKVGRSERCTFKTIFSYKYLKKLAFRSSKKN